jgi:hypothetical protein
MSSWWKCKDCLTEWLGEPNSPCPQCELKRLLENCRNLAADCLSAKGFGLGSIHDFLDRCADELKEGK